jgi:pimeloyl-ACP methyl ester carboxylesterase
LASCAVAWHWPRTADLRAWERVSFASRSGARLAGLYGTATSERKGVVVCAHPLRKDAKGYFLSSGRADVLRRGGFDVLLFDFNGFGESSHGDFNYVQDVLAAGEFAYGRAGTLPVHALGACFGAVWTLCAATQDHPFSGIVVEAPFTSLHEYFASGSLERAFLRLLWRMFPKTAANATPIDAVGRLAGMPRLLVVGGVEDTIAPIGMSRRLYEACNLPRAARGVWYVEGADHLRAFEAAPREYEQRVTEFLAGASVRSALVW